MATDTVIAVASSCGRLGLAGVLRLATLSTAGAPAVSAVRCAQYQRHRVPAVHLDQAHELHRLQHHVTHLLLGHLHRVHAAARKLQAPLSTRDCARCWSHSSRTALGCSAQEAQERRPLCRSCSTTQVAITHDSTKKPCFGSPPRMQLAALATTSLTVSLSCFASTAQPAAMA